VAKRGVKSAFRADLSKHPSHAIVLAAALSIWAYAEEAMCLILAELLETDSARAEIVFYASNSARLRVDLIRNLAKAYVPESHVRKQVIDAINKFGHLSGTRNLYVHGLWKYTASGRLAVVGTKQGPLNWFSSEHRVSYRKLATYGNETAALEQMLMEALAALRNASARRSLPQPRRRRLSTARPSWCGLWSSSTSFWKPNAEFFHITRP
jgi:hypothetical protein